MESLTTSGPEYTNKMSSEEQELRTPASAASAGSFESAVQDITDRNIGTTPIRNTALFHGGVNSPEQLPSYFRDDAKLGFNRKHVDEENEDEGLDCESVVDVSDAQEVVKYLAIDDHDQDHLNVPFSDENAIQGLDPSLPVADCKIPRPPDDWKTPETKFEKGEIEFGNLDNPGGWGRYAFVPKFKPPKEGGMYLHHELPTKARPVPINSEKDSLRESHGWVFYYQPWKLEESWKSDFFGIPKEFPVPTYRPSATQANVLPLERKGYLNYDLMKKMGLTKRKLLDGDPLFFFQLLLPLCDPAKSGIENDPRLPYYSKVALWTQLYATNLGLGGSYGHHFKSVLIPELIRYDGCIMRDGVLNGSSDGAIYRRWDKLDATFSPQIYESMSYHRFLQLKRTLKMNDNSTAKKKGEEGYDPTYKYDYPFKVMVQNICAFTAKASMDLCGDETTCGHQGYGEASSGVLDRIPNKPGITKGMQTVLLCDVHRFRVYAYIHRHKCHQGWPEWCKKQGPTEVRILLEEVESLMKRGKLWDKKPHSTWENHFSGDEIMEWMGKNGFGGLMTCRRDRLPKDVPSHYFHFHKHDSSCTPARVARFYNPITAVKICRVPDVSPPEFYTRTHVSMQSTSSTNFSSVNSLDSVDNWIQTKERGRVANGTKQVWGIEMNNARSMYLHSYGQVDTLDSMLNRCCIFQKSFKYWHAARNHALSIAIVMAWDMYRECVTESQAHIAWGFDERDIARAKKSALDFKNFYGKLSLQALAYCPKQKHYLGDQNMREVTKLSKRKRGDSSTEVSESTSMPHNKNGILSREQFNYIQKKRKLSDSRYCGDLSKFKKHLESKTSKITRLKCAVCGRPTRTKCGICDIPLHDKPNSGEKKDKNCFIDYHDECMVGLCRTDCSLFSRKQNEWKSPTAEEKQKSVDSYRRFTTGAIVTRSRGGAQPSEISSETPGMSSLSSLSNAASTTRMSSSSRQSSTSAYKSGSVPV